MYILRNFKKNHDFWVTYPTNYCMDLFLLALLKGALDVQQSREWKVKSGDVVYVLLILPLKLRGTEVKLYYLVPHNYWHAPGPYSCSAHIPEKFRTIIVKVTYIYYFLYLNCVYFKILYLIL